MKPGKFTGIIFALAVIILLQTSFDLGQAQDGPVGQLWYYVIDDYFSNPNFTPVLNWTQDVGVKRLIFAVCNHTFDGINKTCPQAFSKWTFTPEVGPISWSNYDNISNGSWKYPANIEGIANPQNPRYITFFKPGLYKLEAIGFCPGWGGSWLPIIAHITVRGIQNLTNVPPLKMQNELDAPAVYGPTDFSNGYAQWRSPYSGVGIVAANQYYNPFEYPIQIGYLNVLSKFDWKYTHTVGSDYMWATAADGFILDDSTLKDGMEPITPYIILQPGETKSTIPFNSMTYANLTNCTTYFQPSLPVVQYQNNMFGWIYVMIKPIHPIFPSYWVPMQMGYYESLYSVQLDDYSNGFKITYTTFNYKEVPMTDSSYVMPQWAGDFKNETFMYSQFRQYRNATYPNCWNKVTNYD